jgi:FixJ family two-component response regulator
MPDERSLVSVVDDDESVRESLPDLLNEFGYSVRTFSSALEFLASDALEQTKCLILDVAMPGMNGMELQAELKRHNKWIPIVFITAIPDEAVRGRVVELGATACLTKPFSDTALFEALRSVMPPIEARRER